MARKRYLFFNQLSTLKTLRYSFLGLIIVLLLIFNPVRLLASSPNSESAQTLTQLGFEQLHNGQPNSALKTWQSAYQAYKILKNQQGMTGSLINQSLALQAIGSYPVACKTLTQALKIEYSICPDPIVQKDFTNKSLEDLTQLLQALPKETVQIIGLDNLGNVLRLMGEPETSYVVLHQALAISSTLAIDSKITNQLLLSIANTEFALYSQAKSKYQLTDEPIAQKKALILAKSKMKSAQDLYQKISSQTNEVSLQAKLNQLKLLLDAKSSIFSSGDTHLNQSILIFVQELLNNLEGFKKMTAVESIYSQLNFSHNLITIFHDDDFKTLLPNNLSLAFSLAQEALVHAQQLDNQRAISSALGTIGYIYNAQSNLPKAQHHFQNAMSFAQSVQAWDIAYEWQWQLGRLYQKTGEIPKSNQVYAAAIASLDQVRGDILPINPDFQFAFKEKVEPVYHEYMELLLSQNQPDTTKLAVEVQEKLKIAELENFLQCGRFPVSTHSQNSKNLSPIIYLIKLGERVEVIVRTPQQFYRHSVDFQILAKPLDNFISLLQKKDFATTPKPNYLLYSQTIYNLLFAPIKQYLPQSGTLGFILDSYFQNLPIAMLHDGEQYLVQSYSIATAFSYEQLQETTKSGRQKALFGGISQVSPSFNDPIVPKNLPDLPEVQTEIKNIKKSIPSASTLINAEFTNRSFRQKIETNSFSVVHLSTHAQFSSDPEQTFVLSWDTPINVKSLKFLLKNEANAIELLVLSACQTAKGDRRSALGIAGIAAQAGAHSTLATLWLVDSASTAQLMDEFYKGLKKGLTKAESLRLAQLTLISSNKYSHPYYWAGFILLGN